jgi:hypothetical protein
MRPRYASQKAATRAKRLEIDRETGLLPDGPCAGLQPRMGRSAHFALEKKVSIAEDNVRLCL